jgi:hypothetical protein
LRTLNRIFEASSKDADNVQQTYITILQAHRDLRNYASKLRANAVECKVRSEAGISSLNNCIKLSKEENVNVFEKWILPAKPLFDMLDDKRKIISDVRNDVLQCNQKTSELQEGITGEHNRKLQLLAAVSEGNAFTCM